MIAKPLRYLADAQSAGLLMGAVVPVILTSVGDSDMSSMASCVLRF
jgi:phosphate acetyltransferase